VTAITALRHATTHDPRMRSGVPRPNQWEDDHAHPIGCGVHRYACNARGRLGPVGALRSKRATSAGPRYSVVKLRRRRSVVAALACGGRPHQCRSEPDLTLRRIGTLASACGLLDLRLIRRFGNNFFRWRATGWQKPRMSAARMRLSSSPLHPVERSHLHHDMVDDGA
jgi:hypothetical protein